MGSIFEAMCYCGFQSGNLPLGGGFRDFETNCSIPALCEKCGHFGLYNYIEKSPVCTECGNEVTFYTSPHLQGDHRYGDGELFSWNIDDDTTVFLPLTDYLCPKCGKMNMFFEHIGMWD